MGRSDRVRYLLTSSYTLQGWVTFIPELLKGCSKVYLVQGASGTGKATLIRGIGEELLKKGYEVEFWLSTQDPSSFDGWYLPSQRIAMVNGTLPGILEIPLHAPVQAVDLDHMLELHSEAELEVSQLKLSNITQQQKTAQAMQKASQARERHDQHYTTYLNLDKAGEVIKNILQELNRQRVLERHYFATIMTLDGKINYIDEISRSCKRRYLLTGPIPAENFILQELAKEIKKRGFALEYYHDGVQGDQLIMLFILELRLAIIAAGETSVRYRPGDVVINLAEIYRPEWTQVLENILHDQRELACSEIELIQELSQEAKIQEALAKHHTEGMNFTLIDQLRKTLIEEIVR